MVASRAGDAGLFGRGRERCGCEDGSQIRQLSQRHLGQRGRGVTRLPFSAAVALSPLSSVRAGKPGSPGGAGESRDHPAWRQARSRAQSLHPVGCEMQGHETTEAGGQQDPAKQWNGDQGRQHGQHHHHGCVLTHDVSLPGADGFKSGATSLGGLRNPASRGSTKFFKKWTGRRSSWPEMGMADSITENTFAGPASMLCGEVDEVRQKAKKTGWSPRQARSDWSFKAGRPRRNPAQGHVGAIWPLSARNH